MKSLAWMLGVGILAAFWSVPVAADPPALVEIGECEVTLVSPQVATSCAFSCLPGSFIMISSSGTGVWHSNVDCGANQLICNADNKEPTCEKHDINLGTGEGFCFAHLNPTPAAVTTHCWSYIPSEL